MLNEMETIRLKVGRDILEIDKNDLIMDNGSCYQIVTKEVCKTNCKHSPVMSKKLFSDLRKCELIFTNEELRQMSLTIYNCFIFNTPFFSYDQYQISKV